MNIAISGLHGTGKSTIAKSIAQKFNLTYYSTGEMFRQLAKEKCLSLEQLSKNAEEDQTIDIELDSRIKIHVENGNCVVDNQLSPYLLGDKIDFCILLKCAKDERIRRMAKRDGDHISKKIRETSIREQSERARFLEIYKVDLLNGNIIMGLFDLILDTTKLDMKSVINIVVNVLENFIENNPDLQKN